MLEYIAEQGKGSVDPLDQATAKMAEGILALRGGKDVPFPQEGTIEIAMQEYKTEPLTPESVTAIWQTFIKGSAEKAGFDLVENIPFCDRSREELEELRRQGRFMVYVHPDINYDVLSKIFPKMQSHSVKEGRHTRDAYKSEGWLDVEANVDSKHWNFRYSGDEETFITQSGKRGQTLRTYIWASQFSKVYSGHYFDEKTMSLLRGTYGHNAFIAEFNPNGRLSVHRGYAPLRFDSRVGLRLEGLK